LKAAHSSSDQYNFVMVDPNAEGTSNPEQLGEFELIERINQLIIESAGDEDISVIRGIGDDAALVRSSSGISVLTTDAVVDGIHFRNQDNRWFDFGWKCAVSNLSDIASMGAIPDHVLITLGLPKDYDVISVEELYKGFIAAFNEFGGTIVGGDVVSSPTMFINLALTGHLDISAAGSEGLMRSQAKVGDRVYISGPLGGSAAGLELLNRLDASTLASDLINRHFRPKPRVDLGQRLVKAGVRCAMDVSDGLMGDLEKMAKASNVGFEILRDKVPFEPGAEALLPDVAIDMALNGGEDYELVFTARPEVVKSFELSGFNLIEIGKVVIQPESRALVTVLDADGKTYEPSIKSWDHLNG
jgi:thiamine-monophosphate kinase